MIAARPAHPETHVSTCNPAHSPQAQQPLEPLYHMLDELPTYPFSNVLDPEPNRIVLQPGDGLEFFRGARNCFIIEAFALAVVYAVLHFAGVM